MKAKYHIVIFAALLAVGFAGCKTESEGSRDTVPPGKLSNVEFTPLNGGGYFRYTIPSDEDYLYARAEYETDAGETISRTSSVYCDSLMISGLGSVRPYEVRLYAVDNSANESEPVVMEVTPLEPNVTAIASTLKIYPGFSALVITLENPLEEAVDIYVNIKTADGREALKVYSSNLPEDRIFINQLEAIPYTVSAYIQDRYGNATPEMDFGTMTPLEDYELSKDSFTFLRDQLLYGSHWDYGEPVWEDQHPYEDYMPMYTQDSMKNAKETNFEGNINKFWDGMIDEDVSYSLNYFHSGTSYPFSYFIDLGREVCISRLRIWQRNQYQWAKYSVKTFHIYISNDPDPSDGVLDDWEYVGEYTLNKPAGEAEAKLEFTEGSEFWVYPDDPQFTRPFRYLRFKAVKDFDNGTIGCMSEITLYGKEAN